MTLVTAMLERMGANTPLSVMAVVLIDNALDPKYIDAIFDDYATKQYTRSLLFSCLVEAMTFVSLRFFKSPRAYFLAYEELFSVTLKSFYEKLQNVELVVIRELVKDNARRLGEVIGHLGSERSPLLTGLRIKILDGNALAGTHHRLKELRRITSAALPGKTLVVLDPQSRLIIDIIPCEDGHAQERSLLDDVLETICVDDLWIEDRNFCTTGFIVGVVLKGGHILVRQHKGLPAEYIGQLEYVGEDASGKVYHRQVRVQTEEAGVQLRQVVLRLNEPTQDGEMEVSLICSVPEDKASSLVLVDLYLKRWTIEQAFNLMTTALKCEHESLGYPKAALFGFAMTVLGYNVLATIQAALASVHGEEKVEKEVSLAKITETTTREVPGLRKMLKDEEWEQFQHLGAKELAEQLKTWAAQVNLKTIKKAPTRKGKKKKTKKLKHDKSKPHVSTAKLLEQRRK